MKNRQYDRLDAAESVFFNRELEHVRAKTADIKYENLKGLSLVPINTEIDPAEETYTYRAYDSVGAAKIIASYAKDFPRADVSGQEYTTKLRSIGVSYGYNIQEIRGAMKKGIPLQQKKANAARRAIEQFHDTLVKTGDTATGLLGFLNQTSALTYTIPADGTGSSKTFGSKTADQVVRDLHNIANYIVEQTKEVEKPETLLVPLSTFNYISQTRMGAGDGAMTILQCFLANNQYIKNVASWTALETAGASSTKRIVAYRRDPDALEYLAPVIMEQFPPQEDMMEYVTPVHARSGGVVAYYPLTICYADGC